MGNEQKPSKRNLPVLRHVVDDDTSDAESLLNEFKNSKVGQGIEAENDREYARKAQERVLQQISSNAKSDTPALRVLGGFGEDAPDDRVWNEWQQSNAAKRLNISDEQEAEQFARQQLMSNIGLDSGEQQNPPQDQEDREPISLEESRLPNVRLLYNDDQTPDDELVEEFRQSSRYDPDSDLPAVSQAEQFARDALYGKVNKQLQQKGKTGKQGNVAFDKEKQEESWTQWMVDTFTPDEETDTPVEAAAKALGNEDVETGTGPLDIAARVADVPARAIEFTGEEIARTIGTTLDLGEEVASEVSEADIFEGDVEEPPEEAFAETDLADVPGLEDAAPAEKLIDSETGEPRSSEEIIQMAAREPDPDDKRALFKAATLSRRKERYDDMDFEDKFARSGKLMGRAAMNSILGLPRQLSAFREEVEEQVLPEDAETKLSDNALAHMSRSAEKFTKNWLPVRDDVKGGFWGDTLPHAMGSMAAFAASGAIAGTAARSFALGRSRLGGTLRQSVDVEDVARPSAGGSVDSFEDFVRNADADEIRETLGDQSLTAQRLRGIDDATQGATGVGVSTPSQARELVANNADDLEQALTVGGNPLFAGSGEVGGVARSQQLAGRLTPALQGGGMTGWNAYKRFKQNPDPRMLENEDAELFRRERAGEELTEKEKSQLDAAIEEQSMTAFWTSAPGGWTEAVAGRFVDNMVGVGSTTPGISVASFKGGVSEFAQETFQSSFDDAARQATSDPELEPFQNTLEEGFAGAIAGAIMGGVSSAVGQTRGHTAELEQLGTTDDGKIPESKLGRTRAGEHQRQLTEERNASGEESTSGASAARTLQDMEEDKAASRLFPMDRRQSQFVRRFVTPDEINAGTIESYGGQGDLERQDRVAEAINEVIDAQDSLDEGQRESLKQHFLFHDVRSRKLRRRDIQNNPEGEEGDAYAGVTAPHVVGEGRFGESHIFADASETDAFEELFHALYDFGGEDARNRAVEAYNQTTDDQVEDYDEGREKIARHFAEEMNRQADVEAAGTVDAARRAIQSAIDSVSPSDPVQQEVSDVLEGQADLDWRGPVDMENSTVVIQGPTKTSIQPSEGQDAQIATGLYSENAADTIDQRIDDVENDNEAGVVYVLRPDPARGALTGEGREEMKQRQQEIYDEYQAQVQPAVEQAQEVINENTDEEIEADESIGPRTKAMGAMQTPQTSKGLPDLADDMSRNELKSLGFRHENHAVNAVNKDRRENDQEEYTEDDTVSAAEVREASSKPGRIGRRLQEQGRPESPMQTNVTAPNGLRRIQSEEDMQRFEESLRTSIRDVRAGEDIGEQEVVQSALNKIQEYRRQAQSFREQAEVAQNSARAEELLRNADRAERAALAIDMGLRERVSRRSKDDVSRRIERLRRAFESEDRFDLFYDEQSQLQRAQQEAEEGQVPTLNRGQARVMPEAGGAVVRQVDEATGQIVEGTTQRIARIDPEQADDIPSSMVVPDEAVAEIVGEEATDGTWVNQNALRSPQSYVEQQQERIEGAQGNLAAQQQAETRIRNVAQSIARMREEQFRQEPETEIREEATDETAPEIDEGEIERGDPTDVAPPNRIEQAILQAQRARARAFDSDVSRSEALSELREVNSILSGNEGQEAIEVDFDSESLSRTNDTDAKVVLARTYNQARKRIKEGPPEIETPDSDNLEIEDRDALRERLIDIFDQEGRSRGDVLQQATATADLFDARAEAFASQTGLSKSLYYKSRIAQITGDFSGISESALNQIRTYHGSPYYFSNFDTQYIGEGEGEQAFGWGIYVTGSEQVARHHYADRLAQQKGEAEWSVLGGEYTISREAGESFLTITGPEGGVLETVEQADRNAGLQRASDRLADALEDARKIIAQDAIDRGLGAAPETLGLVEQRNQEALQAERERFDAQARLQNNEEFQRLVQQVQEQVNAVIPGAETVGAEALEFDVLADMQRVVVEGFDSIFEPTWESDLFLTLESEFGVPVEQSRELSDFLAQEIAPQLNRIADETGYTAARQREVEARNRYEAARREFRSEIDVELSNVERVLFDATIHEGRDPSEYTYMRWRREPTQEEYEGFLGAVEQLAEEHELKRVHQHSSFDAFRRAIEKARDDVEGRVNVRDLFFDTQEPDVGDIYQSLHNMTTATPKDVSLALLDNGIDGIVFRGNNGQGNYDNHVVFDDSVISINSTEMFQKRGGNVTGAIDFLNDGRAKIALAENADADTFIEEMGHLLLEDMPFQDRQIVADALRSELGNPDIMPRNLRDIEEAHEQFADWFRRYVREGEAPTSTLAGIFENIKQVMSRIWERLGGTAFVEEQVPKDVRAAIDRLFLPDDPRAVTQDPAGKLEDIPDTPGAKRTPSGERVFYPQLYKQKIEQDYFLHRLTTKEYNELTTRVEDGAETDIVLAPNNLDSRRKQAVQRALADGRFDEVPNSTVKEFYEDAPEVALRAVNLDGADISSLETTETEIRDGVPPQAEVEAEVNDQGEVTRDIDLNTQEGREILSLVASMNERQARNASDERIREIEKGKQAFVFGGPDPTYVTPAMVETKFNAVGRGRRINNQTLRERYEEVQDAIGSDEFSGAEEMRAFYDDELSGEAQERASQTLEKINKLMGADNITTTLEEARAKITNEITQNFRQARELYRQHQIAVQQDDYPTTAKERTDAQNELRQRNTNLESVRTEEVPDEIAEALEQTDPGDAVSLLFDNEQDKLERARNEDLDWQERGEGFTPVEWFEEFWLAQSGRSKSDRPGIVQLAENREADFLNSDGSLRVGFGDVESFGTDIAVFPADTAKKAWASVATKGGLDGDVDGGLFYIESVDSNPGLASRGLTDRAVIVTPEFVFELGKKKKGTAYELQIREPTSEELSLSESEADRLAWRGRSEGDAKALTEETSAFYNDAHSADQGNYSVEDKLDLFAAERPTYQLSGDGVLVEQNSEGRKSDADGAQFSLIAPEAEGPVAIAYDGNEVHFATDDALAEELREKYEDKVARRIDEIDDQGPDLFGDENVVATESVDGNTVDYVEGLRDMMNMSQRIAVVRPQDVDPNDPGAFTGEHRAGRLIPHDAMHNMESAPTWVGEFGNGDYYIVVREDGFSSESYKAEAIAHEMGHLIFQERLNSDEHADAYKRLRSEHAQSIDLDRTVEEHIEQFMSYHRLRVSDYIDSVGDLTMSQLQERNPQLFRYLTSFEEWVAEQTARYVTTEEAAASSDSVVQRLYDELRQYFQAIYQFLMQNGFGPNVEFATWMRHHIEQKETEQRQKQTQLVRKGRPYNAEARAEEAIENGQEQLESDVRERIRDAVQNDQDLRPILRSLPQEDQVVAAKYAQGFAEAIFANNREYPDGSFQVDLSFATSPPTDAKKGERFRDTIRRSIRESTANDIRRKYYTPVQRHIKILGEKYPILKDISDEVFAAPDDQPESETFTESLRRRRNEYLPQLADIFRRLGDIDPRPREEGQFAQTWLGENIPDWLKKSGRIGQVMDILRDPNMDATNEQAVLQATGDEVVAREARRLRNLMDDFFDYLVNKGALPESAKLENYFPAKMDVDEVAANPEAFEDMLFNQMRKQAARNTLENPTAQEVEEFTFDLETEQKVRTIARKIRQGILEQNGGDRWAEVTDLMKEESDRFSRIIGATPGSLKHRYLRFINHNDSEVRQFYEQDPVAILEHYFNGNIRYAEYADRFGANGEKIDAAVSVLNEAGAPDGIAERLQAFMAAVRGTYAGHLGRGWQELQRGKSKSAKAWQYADSAVNGLRNFVTFQLMQAVGVASTLPETMAIPMRNGFVNSLAELPGSVWQWLTEGVSETRVRAMQRLGRDAERDRTAFQKAMIDSGALADRTVDEIVRSRIRAGGGVQGRLMKWFFNLNLLRPITRLQRTWASKAGHRHIVDALRNAEDSPRLMRELERLGLPTDRGDRADMIDVIERMRSGEDGVWETEEAQQYKTALARIAQQTVVEGEAASRPLWMSSRNPLLRLHGQFKSFAAAYREGPLAYMSDEVIQNDTDSLQQSLRIGLGLLAMGAAAGVADWIRWSLYYDMGDPEQREIKRDMVNTLNFGESLESLQNGEFGRAATEVSGIPRIVERTGVPGTATFGTYYPITSVRQFDANFVVQLLGPAASQTNTLVNAAANGNYQQVESFVLRGIPGGQAMRYREQYTRWLENGAPMPWNEQQSMDFLNEDGSGTTDE